MLNIGTIELPLQAVTKTFAILAKKGAGKSYTAGVMMEEMYKNNIPFVVFDPIDVHWGLRLKADGKSQGLNVVVFGVLENADIPLTEDMGVAIAHAVAEKNISCVISTFGMSKKAQRKLIIDFSEELIRINKSPRHIFIEEAHEFVPQRIGPEMGRVFSAVEALVVMGRNKGLGVTLINQRAATINKDVLTQIDTLMAFRNTAPHDRKALQEWVEAHGTEEDFNSFMSSLPSLPTGEGWIWSPEWLDKFEKVKIRQRETLHPDRENFTQDVEMPEMENIDMKEFIKSFQEALQIEKPEKKKKKDDVKIGMDFGKGDDQSILTEYVSIEIHEEALKEKDKEISRLTGIINNASKVLRGEGTEIIPTDQAKSTGVVEMWLDKIGRSNSAGKILNLLKEKNGLKFTRHQIRTMVGISSKSSGFNTAISLLRRNDLIREENGYIVVNPEIL